MNVHLDIILPSPTPTKVEVLQFSISHLIVDQILIYHTVSLRFIWLQITKLVKSNHKESRKCPKKAMSWLALVKLVALNYSFYFLKIYQMHPNIIFIVKCIGIPTFGTSTVSTSRSCDHVMSYRFSTVLFYSDSVKSSKRVFKYKNHQKFMKILGASYENDLLVSRLTPINPWFLTLRKPLRIKTIPRWRSLRSS